MRRRFVFTFLCVLVVAIAGFTVYSSTYTIPNDKKQIESNIIQSLKKTTSVNKGIDIEKQISIDNKEYILFTFNENLGYAELTKGFINKYKLEYTSYGSSLFKGDIIKSSKGKYMLLMGKNYDKKIASTKVLLDGNKYKFNIPDQKYFIIYCSVPSNTKEGLLDINNVKLYDSKNVDITDILK